MTTAQTNFREELTNGLIQLEDTFGVTVTWGGTQYAALMSSIKFAEKFTMGGFDDSQNFELTFRKLDSSGAEVFAGGLPLIGDRITLDGVEYRVISYETDPVDPTFRLTMGNVDT